MDLNAINQSQCNVLTTIATDTPVCAHVCLRVFSPSTDSLNRASYLKWFWSVSLRRKYDFVVGLQVRSVKSLRSNFTFNVSECERVTWVSVFINNT